MSGNNHIFIIDDDEKLNSLLSDYLVNFGFSVDSVSHPQEGLEKIKNVQPSLVVLDVMLPEMDGFEVLRQIRKSSDIPVIMLTARGEPTDKIVGLEIGADDYLGKPFEPRELVARIQSVLRRTKPSRQTRDLSFEGLAILTRSHQVVVDGNPIELTSTEYELLLLFAENAGKVLSRDEILESVRGIEWESYNRSVDVLISRLRQKLNDDPKHPRYLKTIWGSGYLFLPAAKS